MPARRLAPPRLAALALAASLAGCSSCGERPPPPTTSVASPAASPHHPEVPDNAGPAAPAPAPPGVEIHGWDGVPAALAASRDPGAPGDQGLLTRVFPRLLPSPDRCPEGALTLAQARAQGLVAPRVERRVRGAFSRADAREELLDVAVHECGATHADDWGSHLLVIVRGGEDVATAPLEGHLAGAADLDGDGRAEILLQGGGSGQGIRARTLQVARLEAGGLAVLTDLGTVYEGRCGGQRPEGEEVTLVRAVARGGAALDFVTRKERRACP